jgi:hypothetical protein
VDFDEKTPIELLQILNDVFTQLEAQMKVGSTNPVLLLVKGCTPDV